MTIKVLYYVDVEDNTKGALIAFPIGKELRNKETIATISQVLQEGNFAESEPIANVVAWELVHNNEAELTCTMGKYHFGFEETELFS